MRRLLYLVKTYGGDILSVLTTELINRFVKSTNDKKEDKKESIVYGTVVLNNGKKFVKIDGSDILTPVQSTTKINTGEKVTVMIKNHNAIITGNISSPAIRDIDLTDNEQEIITKITDSIKEYGLDETGLSLLNKPINIIDDKEQTVISIMPDGKIYFNDGLNLSKDKIHFNDNINIKLSDLSNLFIESPNINLNGNTNVTGDCTINSDNISLTGNTSITGNCSIKSDNISLTGNTNIFGNFLINDEKIIDSNGSNNQYYIKFNDGTLICYGKKTYGNNSMTTEKFNGVFVDETLNNSTITFPKNFTDTPVVTCCCKSEAYLNYQSASVNASSMKPKIWSSYSTSVTTLIFEYVAIGKWK